MINPNVHVDHPDQILARRGAAAEPRRGSQQPEPPAAEHAGGGAVPAAGREPAADARAVDARARGRGGAAGGAAERLGLLEARRVPRHGLEPDVRRGHGGSDGPEPRRVAVDAA